MQIILKHISNDIQLRHKKFQSSATLYCFNHDTDNHNNHDLVSSYCYSHGNNRVNLIYNHVILIICIKVHLITKFNDHSYYNSEEK